MFNRKYNFCKFEKFDEGKKIGSKPQETQREKVNKVFGFVSMENARKLEFQHDVRGQQIWSDSLRISDYIEKLYNTQLIEWPWPIFRRWKRRNLSLLEPMTSGHRPKQEKNLFNSTHTRAAWLPTIERGKLSENFIWHDNMTRMRRKLRVFLLSHISSPKSIRRELFSRSPFAVISTWFRFVRVLCELSLA